MSDLFSQLEKQIAQDFLDKKTDAIYDCSEIYSLIEHKDREIEERDRKILQLNHDYNESTDELKREIEERDQKIINLEREIEDLKSQIALHDEQIVYTNLGEQLETASRRFVSIRRSVREIFKNLKDTRVHLNSLHIDMGLLGSWSKNWDTEETAFTTLTHHEKNKLASIKAIQLKHLEDITEKNLKELSKVFEMVKTDDNDNDDLDEIPF